MMLTKRSRMTSLVAIAATVMLVLSTNVANASIREGYKWCLARQVGGIDALVWGSGYLRAPGAMWQHVEYFSYQGYYGWADAGQRGRGGGPWTAEASVGIRRVKPHCINGNF